MISLVHSFIATDTYLLINAQVVQLELCNVSNEMWPMKVAVHLAEITMIKWTFNVKLKEKLCRLNRAEDRTEREKKCLLYCRLIG